METAIVLVEWPDRLGRFRPAGAAVLRLMPEGEGRRARLSGDAALIGALKAGGWA